MRSLAFSREAAHGRLVGVALPADDDAAGLDALAAALRPEERAHAAALAGPRRATWLGGRVALRAALEGLGVDAAPLLATERGAPLLPAGIAGSISHKATLAVALAARAGAGETLGVDVELDPRQRPPRVDIAPRVLTPTERTRLDALAPTSRARELLVAFAAKEAIYKALDPWVQRFVSFQEVEIARTPDGALSATLHLPEPPFTVDLREEPTDDLILITARLDRLRTNH